MVCGCGSSCLCCLRPPWKSGCPVWCPKLIVLICSWRCGCNVAIMCNYLSPTAAAWACWIFFPQKNFSPTISWKVCLQVNRTSCSPALYSSKQMLQRCSSPKYSTLGRPTFGVTMGSVGLFEGVTVGPDSPHSSTLPIHESSSPAVSSSSGADDEEHVPADD